MAHLVEPHNGTPTELMHQKFIASFLAHVGTLSSKTCWLQPTVKRLQMLQKHLSNFDA